MKPFMFVIKSIPLPENQNYAAVSSAHVHIWVMDDDIVSAQRRALDYIKDLLWNPQKIEYAFEISREQIPSLHIDEAKLYYQAFQHDIAAHFLASPRVEGNPDDPVIVGRP